MEEYVALTLTLTLTPILSPSTGPVQDLVKPSRCSLSLLRRNSGASVKEAGYDEIKYMEKISNDEKIKLWGKKCNLTTKVSSK